MTDNTTNSLQDGKTIEFACNILEYDYNKRIRFFQDAKVQEELMRLLPTMLTISGNLFRVSLENITRENTPKEPEDANKIRERNTTELLRLHKSTYNNETIEWIFLCLISFIFGIIIGGGL